jgi:hypothetical protein
MPEVASQPIPAELTNKLAQLSKTGVLGAPEVMHGGRFINWAEVKKVDDQLDNFSSFKARGAEIKGPKAKEKTAEEQLENWGTELKPKLNQPDAQQLREVTKIKVTSGDQSQETNLVDHLLKDEQIKTILLEGIQLGVVTEQDFKFMGVKLNQYKSADTVDLALPPLTRMQKAETISTILNKLGERNPQTLSLFADRINDVILGDKNVKQLGKMRSTGITVINALSAGAREELSKYILEQGYTPYSMEADTPEKKALADKLRRSVAAEVVDTVEEGGAKVPQGETPYFAKYKTEDELGNIKVMTVEEGRATEGAIPVAEYSARVDMLVAQGMTNAMIPPEFHLMIDSLEQKIQQTTDVEKQWELRHDVTKTKQKIYAAILNVYGVKGYEEDGEVYAQMKISGKEKQEILKMAKSIKESKRFESAESMTLFEANRFSLAEITSKVMGVPADKLDQIMQAFPIEGKTKLMRDELRNKHLSERMISEQVRDTLSEDFIAVLIDTVGRQKAGILKDPNTVASLKKFFLRTYDTEQSLIVKSKGKKLNGADIATELKIRNGGEMGLKGLKLLHQRSQTEQEYDMKEYMKALKESEDFRPEDLSAVIEQGTDKKGTDEAKAVRDLDAEKKANEEAQRLEDEKQKGIAEGIQAGIKTEEERQAKLKEYRDRTPLNSLNVKDIPDDTEGEVYVNELMQKLDHRDVTSDDINDEMNQLLDINPEFAGLFRGPLKKIKEIQLKKKDPSSFANYEELKKAKDIAQKWEAIPADDEDGIQDARLQFFVPHEEET